MRIDIITIFPAMLEGFVNESILKRAAQKGLAEIHLHNLREYSEDKHRKTDDYTFGGGAGMVMTPQPLADAIDTLKKEREYDEVIFLSPDGDLLTQPVANEISLLKNIILVCGRYKGIDQRIRDAWITREISIGEYVLSGGELAAAVLADAVIRLIPGVLNDETSALLDSFQGDTLAPPVYTRPADFRGMKVPDVLLNGNQKEIDAWRDALAEEKTKARKGNK